MRSRPCLLGFCLSHSEVGFCASIDDMDDLQHCNNQPVWINEMQIFMQMYVCTLVGVDCMYIGPDRVSSCALGKCGFWHDS
jgi:hypothetical protein